MVRLKSVVRLYSAFASFHYYLVVQSREHRELANEVTSKSFVMLKNNGALPLQRLFNKVTVSRQQNNCHIFHVFHLNIPGLIG